MILSQEEPVEDYERSELFLNYPASSSLAFEYSTHHSLLAE